MLRILALASFLAAAPVIAQPFQSGDQVVQKLSSYSFNDLRREAELGRPLRGKTLKADALDHDLQAASEYFKGRQASKPAALQMMRALLMIEMTDGGNPTAIDYVAPIYDKNRDVFRSAMKDLHPTDRKYIRERLGTYCLRRCG
ncbi:hypothetical protein RT97_05270 [Variovorax paradoxus]|uniref:Uncharacterized protein n=1 Tax=Variovorax paradoxus TaxID=34073 RepID=A0A0D0MS27_VARPD|nr:hypothetical protein [Variovorax paradoxus]KIQ35316.1 hypothetical protein RT97_05270 [Variovorax paradoxus]